jgi:hypothetical protein
MFSKKTMDYLESPKSDFPVPRRNDLFVADKLLPPPLQLRGVTA